MPTTGLCVFMVVLNCSDSLLVSITSELVPRNTSRTCLCVDVEMAFSNVSSSIWSFSDSFVRERRIPH